MQGDLTVKSKKGLGSIFSFNFPITVSNKKEFYKLGVDFLSNPVETKLLKELIVKYS